MASRSAVFEQHYQGYLRKIGEVDFDTVKEILGAGQEGSGLTISFLNATYSLSADGICDHDNNRPDYMTCVILSKYLLLCPSDPQPPAPD